MGKKTKFQIFNVSLFFCTLYITVHFTDFR